jgi:hypothetical protein
MYSSLHTHDVLYQTQWMRPIGTLKTEKHPHQKQKPKRATKPLFKSGSQRWSVNLSESRGRVSDTRDE